jgi:RNA polymerase sigma-70 factor (ECF subfamily)
MLEPDDMSLLKAIAQRRDQAAFTEFCERYRRRAFGVASRILCDHGLAEDAVQDVMITIWRTSNSALPKGDVEDWILRIVTNKSLYLRRSKRNAAKKEERMATEKTRTQTAAIDEAEINDLKSKLREEISRLPELERDVLVCSYCTKMTHREIAQLVDIPQRTVTDKIHAAVERLRLNLLRAGVVAVAPLLCKDSLFEVLTTGHDCPPGMMDRLMERLARPETEAAKQMSRRIKTKAAGTAWTPIAAGLLIAGIATVAFMQNKPTVSPSTAPTHPTPPAIVQVEDNAKASPSAQAPISQEWNFAEKSDLDGIKVTSRNWVWGHPFGRGAMSSSNSEPVSLVLPNNVDHRCLKLSISGTSNSPQMSSGVSWMNGLAIPHSRIWQARPKTRYESVAKVGWTYIFSHNSILVTNCDGDFCSMTQFDNNWAGDRIVIRITNLTVEKITLQSISEQEVANVFAKFRSELEALPKTASLENDPQVVPVEAMK